MALEAVVVDIVVGVQSDCVALALTPTHQTCLLALVWKYNTNKNVFIVAFTSKSFHVSLKSGLKIFEVVN